MTKVLISYSRKDSVVARKLIDAFKTINLDVWVDWEDIPPAVGWLDQILRGIEGSDAFIFLISPDSIVSEVCNVEIEHAAKNNKRIIPIVIRDVDAKSVTPIIRELNWIHIREQDSFEEGIAKVKTAIELDLEWVEEHRRLQVRALEWHRKKDPSLLLRGGDLRYARSMLQSSEAKDPKPTALQKTYIEFSARDERRRITLWIATAVAVTVMAILSLIALDQRSRALQNEAVAIKNKQEAERNRLEALVQANAAKQAQARAEDSENIARAQRSAARAQIYQSRPGELFTSTLLAVDSWLRHESPEAEEILRENISLLPVPVAQESQLDAVNALEFSPGGDTFLTASGDATACMWRVGDGEKLFCVTSNGSVEDAAFSPVNDVFATGDASGLVMVVNSTNGEVLGRFDFGVPVWDVNISPDGKLLAAARDDSYITVIDLVMLKKDFELFTDGRLKVSAFSPNGRWIAAGSSIGSVILWNLETGKSSSAPSHREEVLTVVFSPDSRVLVTGGADSTVYVSSVNTGQEYFHILNEDWVEDIAFSPDSSWFVTVSDDRRIRVWDMRNNEKIRMSQDSSVTGVEVSANGQWIATTGLDRTVRVWNAATGVEIFQIPLKDVGSAIAFSEDGKYLISGDRGGEIGIWEISGIPAPEKFIQFSGFTGSIRFSPSGDRLLASNENRVWSLNPEQLPPLTALSQIQPLLPPLKSIVRSVRMSPDSNRIAIFTDAGEIVLYNVNDKTTKVIPQLNLVTQFVFSFDGLRLFTGDLTGTVQVWDTETGGLVESWAAGDSEVTSIAAGKTFAAVGLLNKLVIFDAAGGEKVSEINNRGNHEVTVFSADGTLLASANSTGQINVWRGNGGRFDLMLSISSVPADTMVFSPDGSQLAVNGIDVVRLFDLSTGKEIKRIANAGIVDDIAFSADGQILITVSNKVVQFWDVGKMPAVPTGNLVATACSRVTANFDQAQWNALFGDEEYRVLCEGVKEP